VVTISAFKTYITAGIGSTVRDWGLNCPIEFFTYVGERPSSWAMVEAGREIYGGQRDTYPEIVHGWLRDCAKNHPNCRQPPSVLPSRVINVGTLGSTKVFLYTSRIKFGRYTALSHCWGKAPTARTTTQNFRQRQQGIPFDVLPQTFQDAVMVTRSLGIKYLWIDSLCIIQDDETDWQRESGNMSSIYSNAYFVIGADSSADCNGGFLKPKNRQSTFSSPVAQVSNDDGSVSTVYTRVRQRHGNICDGTPLASRAWTLQEQLLSSRIVHFTHMEIVWECRTSLRCECMELDAGWVVPSNLKSKYHKSMKSSLSKERSKIWWDLVEECRNRNITFETDLLPALSGIARQMQKHGAGEYLTGIWKKELPEALMWWSRYSTKYDRVVPYRAPSWSWASLKSSTLSQFTQNTFAPQHRKLAITYVKVLEAFCIPVGDDYTGAVSSGLLILSAPLIEVTYNPSGETLKLLDDNAESNAIALFDIQLNLKGGESFHCLFIGESEVDANCSPRCEGLILKHLSENLDYWERVGMFFVDNRRNEKGQFDPRKFFKDAIETVVKII